VGWVALVEHVCVRSQIKAELDHRARCNLEFIFKKLQKANHSNKESCNSLASTRESLDCYPCGDDKLFSIGNQAAVSPPVPIYIRYGLVLERISKNGRRGKWLCELDF
jgi:hypothetical protein